MIWVLGWMRMTTVFERAKSVMKSESSNTTIISSMLYVFSGLYGVGVSFRNKLYDNKLKTVQSLPCPVISIGNIAVGGTGKTPMTLFLSRYLLKKGLKPVILSRGYGGSASEHGGMVSDGDKIFMEPHESGDEPYLMATLLKNGKGVPVFVGKDRYAAGMEAFRIFSPDLFLLDDGYQHRTLHRDLDIVLLDSEKPFGNGHLLPRGILREPVSALERGDAFVLTRADISNKNSKISEFWRFLKLKEQCHKIQEKPVFLCNHKSVIRGIVKKGSRKLSDISLPGDSFHEITAFSGIANNDDFYKSLIELGFNVKLFFNFKDHYPYHSDDLEFISTKSLTMGIDTIATTEKDYVRFHNSMTLPVDLIVLGADLEWGDGIDKLTDMVCKLTSK